MSHPGRTPDWVNNFSEDYILRDEDGWYYNGFSGMPLRYHGGHGHVNHGYTTEHREVDSYSLRTSHTGSYRRRSSCCLLWILLLGALLVAIGIGVMVYYLMKMNPDPREYYSTRTNGSVPLLNVPYSSSMQADDSDSFVDIAEPFCKEIDKYFKNSQYADRYVSCRLNALKPDEAEAPCSCAGILEPVQPGNTRAFFNVAFRGDFGDNLEVNRKILQVIDDNAPRITGQDFEVIYVDDFIIDVRNNLKPLPTVTPPRVGVLANLSIWVYNMTYSPDLTVKDSEKFNELARPFCRELERIFLVSPLGTRYHSCSVEQFSFRPDIANVHVWFKDDNVTGIESDVQTIILDGARQVLVENILRKIIGTLLITDRDIVVVPIPVNPDVTITPTPTTYRPPIWIDGMPYIEVFLKYTGLEFNSSMGDPNSDYFLDLQNRFCKDMEGVIMKSEWMRDFYSCQVLNFFPPEQGEIYPKVKAIIKVTNRVQDETKLDGFIRMYGNKFVFPIDMDTYKLGDLYVILDDDFGGFGLFSLPYDDPTTIPDVSPTMFPDVFTSFGIITPSTSIGQTVTPPLSTSIIVYNSTIVYIESGLVNFTFTGDLQNSTSDRFMEVDARFCADIDKFFNNSILQSVYKTCEIVSFEESLQKVSYQLTLTAPAGDYLQAAIPSIIIHNAPQDVVDDKLVLRVGELNLLHDFLDFNVTITNYTVPDATIMPTATFTTMIPTTSISVIVYSATLADFTCDVLNGIQSDLLDKTTPMFTSQQAGFCSDMLDTLDNDERTEDYLDCYIMNFSQNPNKVQTHITFTNALDTSLVNHIRTVFGQHAPTVQSQTGQAWNFGGVLVRPGSCVFTLHPVNVTSSQTMFPSLSPSTPTIQPSLGTSKAGLAWESLVNHIPTVFGQHAPTVQSQSGQAWNFGGVLVRPGSCVFTLHPVNVTSSQTMFPSLSPSTPTIQPSLGKSRLVCIYSTPCQCHQQSDNVPLTIPLNTHHTTFSR